MRLLGAGLLWTSLIIVGVAYSVRLKRRVVLLEKTKLMIEEIKTQVKFLNLPLYDILKSIADKEQYKMLAYIGECCVNLQNGDDFQTSWCNSIQNNNLPYKREEIDRLLHMGLNLGASDAENQLRMLELNSEYFIEYISRAKSDVNKYGDMTAIMGALSGCVIFILLL